MTLTKTWSKNLIQNGQEDKNRLHNERKTDISKSISKSEVLRQKSRINELRKGIKLSQPKNSCFFISPVLFYMKEMPT